MKIFNLVGNIIIALLLMLALYAQFGGIAAQQGGARYVKQLEAEGQKCTTIKQQTGPAHTRKIYWVCDGVEIKWWHGHFWEWWDK